jgi:hypothetical protein
MYLTRDYNWVSQAPIFCSRIITKFLQTRSQFGGQDSTEWIARILGDLPPALHTRLQERMMSLMEFKDHSVDSSLGTRVSELIHADYYWCHNRKGGDGKCTRDRARGRDLGQ